MPTGANLAIAGDFSNNNIGLLLPVMTGLEYANWFGDSAAKTPRNLVVGKPAASVVGAPVVGAGFATFVQGTSYVQTGLLDQSEVTLIAVARPNGGSAATQFKYIIGDYTAAGAQQGSNMYFGNTSTSLPSVAAARNNGTSDVFVAANTTTSDNAAAFAFYAGRMGAAFNRMDDKTRNLFAAGAITNPRSVPATSAYRIGSSGLAANGGSTDIALALIYSRCLTDAEIASVYSWAQANLAAKGIAA